ncbi:MAG: ComF family protein, partial [Sciscionella sp.]
MDTPLATVLDLVLPARCAGCGMLGAAWCARCRVPFARPSSVHRSALRNGPPTYALADYADAARAVVLAYKERGRRDLARPLGLSLAAVLPTLPGAGVTVGDTWWLVPAPSRRRAARGRGGSHMLRLARHCAVGLAAGGRPAAVAPALRMAAGVRDSAGLSAEARLRNLAGRIRPDPGGLPPRGSRVVLLDDV